MPDLSIEKKYEEQIVCGVDEVGRGCLAGDVYACAVILPTDFPRGILKQLKDSKKLSAKKREHLCLEIKRRALWAIGVATVEEIDDLNILNASMLAMKRAVLNLQVKPHVLLIDGNKSPEMPEYIIETVIKGDSKSSSIAGASIVAKVIRDEKMTELAEEFPHYLWEKNAGYGTKEHIKALEKEGVTEWHRKTFAPVKTLLKSL